MKHHGMFWGKRKVKNSIQHLWRGVVELKNLAAVTLLIQQGAVKCKQPVSEMKTLEKSMREWDNSKIAHCHQKIR